MAMKNDTPDGPIPGENYTSDTKNYPWHRPPEYTDLNDALDHVAKHMTQSRNAMSMLTLAKAGIPLTSLVGMFVISGIGKGKWTPDFALMMAGPCCKMFELLAKGSEVDYDLGLDDEEVPRTFEFYKAMEEISREAAEKGKASLEVGKDEIIEESSEGGYMADPEGTDGPLAKGQEADTIEGFM